MGLYDQGKPDAHLEPEALKEKEKQQAWRSVGLRQARLVSFWRGIRSARFGQERLNILRAMAEFKLPFPSGYTEKKRQQRDRRRLGWKNGRQTPIRRFSAMPWSGAGLGPCFACGLTKNRIWHHVIQLQNGGYNARRNLVEICNQCHAEIHPWLKK